MDTLTRGPTGVWSQCSIRFVTRSVANVLAVQSGMPYPPQSRADLERIAHALNPNGFNQAIPVTIAGPWNFYDPDFKLYLNGLGWVFYVQAGVIRIGAMMSSLKLSKPEGTAIIAHELGHTPSLPD